ncbi:hypothetical protein BDQ17DRAFT_1549491 [Cyathus striatus]|nr:hypothetical protein BDQ17DRAFT_1549491 [Cyathus striatus]
MDVPDNYYDSLRISPDTNLIGNLHKELLMDICYNLRLVPVDEPESRSDLEDEVGDGERNSEEEEEEAEDGIEASDDENDDNEIFQAVMDLIAARENLESLSHTRRDVLKAVSTIKRYTEDMDDPFSRKVDTILGSFNRRLRLDEFKNMKDTALTDFFIKLT